MTITKEIQIKPNNFRIIWYNIKLVFIILLLMAFCEIIVGISRIGDQWLIERILLFIILVLVFSLRDIGKNRSRLLNISSLGISKYIDNNVNEKIFIAYSDIDITKSKKQILLQRIFGQRNIYSKANTMIEFTPQFYSGKDQKILRNNLLI